MSVALRGCMRTLGALTRSADIRVLNNTHRGMMLDQYQPAGPSQPKEAHMCSPARCGRCGKTTWSGCGMHVDAVMSKITPAQRCACAPLERPVRRFPWDLK